ncbi:AAA family ATPase [candidate division KSB1 bacterium]|nr:AAA family ATPase [candidate division KSB1 bacterium]
MVSKVKERIKALELSADELRWRCDPHIFDDFNEADFDAEHLIIGQDRALKALRLGLDMKNPGYNIFISGYPGTGRKTAVKALLNKKKGSGKTPGDLCYIHNFKNPNAPKAISLAPGEGMRFKNDMESFISYFRKRILPIFNSEYYKTRRQQLIAKFEFRKKSIFNPFEKKIMRRGLALKIHRVTDHSRIELVPVLNEDPELPDDYDSDEVPSKELAAISAFGPRYDDVFDEFQSLVERIRTLDDELNRELEHLDREVVAEKTNERLKEIAENYASEDIRGFLDQVAEDIPERLDDFKEIVQNHTNGNILNLKHPDPFWKYRVNVLVDHSEDSGAPIIWEESPSIEKLFGTIEPCIDFRGNDVSDFNKIRAGSLHAANGGTLIISLASDYNVTNLWYRLKQCLKTGKLIPGDGSASKAKAALSLAPEASDIHIKIILIGDDNHYYSLADYDNEFDRFFKVRADFDTITPKSKFVIHQYVAFIKNLCKAEKLRPFSNTALAAIVENGVRLAGARDKLTTELALIADLAREASYWAETDDAPEVADEHIETAIDEQNARLNLIEQRVFEKFSDGITLIDVTGEKVGQLNGLTVMDLGDYSFGKPVRLTAKSSMGRSGIINIERESDFSGRSHTKGISILTGYFKDIYAQDKTINMTASICFEQSYSRIDGDSASAAEMFVLLSSLGRFPLRQDIAVTASMSQNGEIQPIGGVNEKVEGFYNVCKNIGLTGKQGVIIPLRNIRDLQLRNEVVDAVRRGEFHIYAIETMDEGLEILAGREVAQRSANGSFKRGSIHYLVDRRLKELNKKEKEENGG